MGLTQSPRKGTFWYSCQKMSELSIGLKELQLQKCMQNIEIMNVGKKIHGQFDYLFVYITTRSCKRMADTSLNLDSSLNSVFLFQS